MCPFVDNRDIRCAGHLSLENISSAFEHCADRYKECPVYRRLLLERRTRERAHAAVRAVAGG